MGEAQVEFFEQFSLFDPLHFALMPMVLKREPPVKIVQTMNRTLQLCRQWFGEERRQQAKMKSLAYFVNLCTLYLWAEKGKRTQHRFVKIPIIRPKHRQSPSPLQLSVRSWRKEDMIAST